MPPLRVLSRADVRAAVDMPTAIATVRATTDLTSFKAAYSSIGSACRDCHDQFRTSDG